MIPLKWGGWYVLTGAFGAMLACSLLGPRSTPSAVPPGRTPAPTVVASPTAPPPSASPTATAPPAASPTPTRTLAERLADEPPIHDPLDLARRLKGIGAVPTALASPGAPPAPGETHTFNVLSVDGVRHRPIKATLRYVTPHVYLWVEESLAYDDRAARRLVDRFEAETYPATRAAFGSEWTPGVDGDPHLYILYASGLDSSAWAYFSPADEFPAAANPYSNQHEMFYLNADAIPLDSPAADGVLAHEFQHMIHWANDRNETGWVNEGLAVLASVLNGHSPGGYPAAFLSDPDRQLNTLPGSDGNRAAHYGAGFLFHAYLAQRAGPESVRALVAEPANGLQGADAVLAGAGLPGPRPADDLFADWVVANYLNDPRLDSGRYAYPARAAGPEIVPVEPGDGCPAERQTATVHQYAADYIRITCRGEFVFHFAGSQQVGVVPVGIPGGEFAFWSNRGEQSDMTLTRAFDLSAATAPLRLAYRAWYDIEADFDHVYVEASTDGGRRWTILRTPSGSDRNPTGNSLGWAYTGHSGRGPVPAWIEESVDLSELAGEPEVWIRFEYVTDAAVNGAGFLLDDVSLPEIGYAADFEAGDGGWLADGFIRLNNRLPQTFRVQAILRGPEGTRVLPVALDESNVGEVGARLGDTEVLVVVVSGTARGTEEIAPYDYWITRGD